MRIPLNAERRAILKKLQPRADSEEAIPDARMETFAEGHDTAHLRVLATGGLMGWTQSEVWARQDLEKTKKELPEEFRWKIHALIGAAVLKDHRAVARLAARIQPHAPDELTKAALRVVEREPQKFIQATHAMRNVDPRTKIFGTPSASTPVQESHETPRTRGRGRRTKR